MTGAVVWIVPLVLAVALASWPSGGRAARRRIAAVMRPAPRAPALRGGGPLPDRRPPGAAAPRGSGAWRRWLIALTGGLALGALLGGGGVGLMAAAGGTVVAERLLRRDGNGPALVTSRALESDLPGACELLAVCLTAGLPVAAALAAVGAAVPDPLGAELRAVAALAQLGAGPREAWREVPQELGPLSRVLVRAGESGSTVTSALRALADEGRSTGRARTEEAVRRAGVWVLAPLGLCFLPAFVCLGVAPLVLGIAGTVFR